MSSRSRSRPVALALSIVPGWGHVYWGREILGLCIFTVFAVLGFGLINALVVYYGEGRHLLARSATLLLVLCVGGAWVDIWRRTSPRRVNEEKAARDRDLREGMIAYVRGDLPKAKELFLGCVRSDPFDVEALFRLGVVCARAGEVSEALVWLKRTRRNDVDDKWRWETEQEMARLKGRTATVPAAKRASPLAPAADAKAPDEASGASGDEDKDPGKKAG